MARSGLITGDEAAAATNGNPFAGLSMIETARHFLGSNNVNTKGMDGFRVAGEAFTRITNGSHTSSDFPAVLGNVAAKAVLIGFNEAEETWQEWAGTGALSDFKQADLVALSAYSNIDLVPEGDDFTEGTFSDLKENAQLDTYGKLFQITRQALINDDLSIFNTIPSAMGRAAARKVGDLAYGVLTGNPVMVEDGNTLFNALHNNDAAIGGAPSVSTLNDVFVAMALQKDSSGKATLGYRAAHIVVPVELQTDVETLMRATYDPNAVAGTLTPNPVQGTMKVTSDHRLSADSATQWYCLANPNTVDTIRVYGLNGAPMPVVEREPVFKSDATSFKVRVDAVAVPTGWRGAYRNVGA
ncbi:MAG: hypothetical protein GY761_18640 [Hyphomicrobiales bacterium]|nr:hypothetical protein [Hyphomicrobiales bacterium]